MTKVPYDLVDLALAPVVLTLEDKLESFVGLDQEEIRLRIALDTNRTPRTSDDRRAALLEALLRDVECHGWEVRWASRGLKVRHGFRFVTLGLPDNLRTYLGAG